MISFIRYSKQPYWRPSLRPQDDDIMVADYDADGGCAWEFAVRQYVFGTANASIRVEMFQDSLQALENLELVKALRSLKGCRTLDEVELRLAAAGIPALEKEKAK